MTRIKLINLTTYFSFIVGCVLPYNNGQDMCRIQFVNVARDPQGNFFFHLDFDYYTEKPQSVHPSRALEWVETAHTNVEQIFEGCLTNELRTVFEEVK